MKKDKRILFDIDPDLKKDFKLWLIKNETIQTKVLNEYIKKLVKEN